MEERSHVSSVEDRWRALLASAVLMLTSGSIYLFSAYSATLSETLKLSSSQLALAGAASNVGTWLGLGGGLFCDWYGAWLGGLAGACLACLGYGCMGLAVDDVIPNGVLALACYQFILAQGAGWTYVAAAKSAFSLFHEADRGTLSGVLVCFFALCAGVFTHTFKAVFLARRLHLSSFMYFMAVALFALQSAAAVLGVRRYAPSPRQSRPDGGAHHRLLASHGRDGRAAAQEGEEELPTLRRAGIPANDAGPCPTAELRILDNGSPAVVLTPHQRLAMGDDPSSSPRLRLPGRLSPQEQRRLRSLLAFAVALAFWLSGMGIQHMTALRSSSVADAEP